MIDKPLVTIVIPVYNGSNYVREAIDSALNQTYDNLEIIVINDGSNDNGKTREIALSYGEKINYFEKENGGVSTALNFGIRKMSGEYFSWLSHDDAYLPNKIEKEVDYLVDNNLLDKKVILYSDYYLIDSKSKVVNECKKNHIELMKKPEYSLLLGAVNGLTLLIPKQAFLDYGLFNVNLKCTQDYDLWYKMFQTYVPIHLKETLVYSRYHPAQVSNTSPKVAIEGNELWIKMLRDLSIEDMVRLEGSPYAFYGKMTTFFIGTPYNESLEYCQKKQADIRNDYFQKESTSLISIIIVLFPLQDYQKTMESVHSQTYQNYELLFVTMGNSQIEGSEIFSTSTNKIFKNIADAIQASSGEYVCFLLAGDYWDSTKLNMQLSEIELSNSFVSYTNFSSIGKAVNDNRFDQMNTIEHLFYQLVMASTLMIDKRYLTQKMIKIQKPFGWNSCLLLLLEMKKDREFCRINQILSFIDERNIATLDYRLLMKYVINDEEYYHCDEALFLLSQGLIGKELGAAINKKSNIFQKYYSKITNSIKHEGIKKTIMKVLKKIRRTIGMIK